PRIDHLCFILVKKVLTQQAYRIQLLQQGRYSVQRNENYPLIFSYEGKLVNMFNLEDSQNRETLIFPLIQAQLIEHEDDYIIEDSDDEQDMYESELAYLHKVLDKTKEFLEESRTKSKRHLWLKNIRPNFKFLEKMNNDILSLNNRRTMPRTWQDFNNNTMYWE
ncbi:24615_t:CDS:2, partial [Racocetra persica]